MLEGLCTTGFESIDPAAFYPACNPDGLDARIGGLGGTFDCTGNFGMGFDDAKVEPSSEISSPMHMFSGNLKEWYSTFQGDQQTERVGVLQSEIPSCSTTSSFTEGDAIRITDHADALNLNLLLSETGTQFRHLAGNIDSKGMQTLQISFFGIYGVHLIIGVSDSNPFFWYLWCAFEYWSIRLLSGHFCFTFDSLMWIN